MPSKYDYWYRKTGLKPVTGFLTKEDKKRLKIIADRADKSVARYVSRLLEAHIKGIWKEENPPES